MMNVAKDDAERIVNNLIVLREYNGDTQKELAYNLNFSYHTIVAYECRKRNITQEYIKAVAVLYNIPINLIMEQNLTNELLDSYNSLVDMSDIPERIEVFFLAAATSEEARANQYFMRAEEHRKRIERLDFMEMMTTSARTLYYKSFVEGGILAGAANTLMMIFFEYAQTNVFSNTLRGLTNGELYSKFRELYNDLTPKKKEFIQSTKEMVGECLIALGSVDKAKIYAEYYTALRYMLCMIDNGRDYRENLEIGLIMMKEFSKIGNPFAKKVVEIFELE